VSPTFGERIAEIEEKLDYFGQILDLLLIAVGMMDENGEWTALQEEASGLQDRPGPS